MNDWCLQRALKHSRVLACMPAAARMLPGSYMHAPATRWGLDMHRFFAPLHSCTPPALHPWRPQGIVFANKAVFQTYQFKFTCALTWVHTVFTLFGMRLFLAAGMFERKDLPCLKITPLAAAFVAYIVS